VLNPLYTAVSWVLLRWYWVFTKLGMDPNGGLTWSLSIVMLVVTARVLLFRLFIKQVHYQRRMQEVQPKLQALREKYKNDRGEMQRQMAAFQQAEGFNPLSGCLPMFLQIPIFIALFHVLRRLKPGAGALYSWSQAQTDSVVDAKLFGVPMVAAFRNSSALIHQLGGDVLSTRVLLLTLTLISALATHMTQRLSMARATTVPTGQAATIQKLMLYVIPIFTFGSGFIFPLGVLLYWFTSNNWTMLQQLYINRVHPNTPVLAVAAVGEKGKSLAPKPGARPTRGARLAPPASDSGAESKVGLRKSEDDGVAPTPRSGAPRPGARPSRPAGTRPSGRPAGASKAKKRR
jgi:YidC/Oxa1 family membrane protein insertase